MPNGRQVLQRLSRATSRVLLFAGAFLLLLTLAALAIGIVWPGLAVRLGEQPTAVGLAVNAGVTLACALGVGRLLLAWLDGRPSGSLGFRWSAAAPAELGAGLGVGTAILLVVVGAMVVVGWVMYRSAPGTPRGVVMAWVSGILLLALPAASEEAVYRGYAFQAMVEHLGTVPAVIVGSAAFSAAHLANPGIGLLSLANIFLAGVLLSSAYLWRRSLWLSTGVHLGWNWAMGSLADLPVSGLTLTHTPLYAPVERGPAWITGAGFGPEGGLAATAAFLLGLLALRLVPRRRVDASDSAPAAPSSASMVSGRATNQEGPGD
jgi:CAAX protease family protein